MMMKLVYDKEVNILTFQLNSSPIAESDEIAPGVVADFDAHGHLVGLEILDASRQVESLTELEYKQRIPNTTILQ
jgi:uncharacterized protein YuzE